MIQVLEKEDFMLEHKLIMILMTPATNDTVKQNSDNSPLYFTQPIGVNIAPTANIDLAVNGNIAK